MLLPGTHIITEQQHSPGFLLLKSGADIEKVAPRWNNRPVQPFGGPQAQPGEVIKAGRGIEVQGIDTLLDHQPLSLFYPRKTLTYRDRHIIRARRQFGQFYFSA